MKLGPMGFLGMLISKIAGTTTSHQPFPSQKLKIQNGHIEQGFLSITRL